MQQVLMEIATQLGRWTMQMSGRGMPFNYNRNEMIEEPFKNVNGDEMSFNHGESYTYEYFNRKTLQPQYRAVPINTLQRRIIKLYEHKC